ncbi:sensor histidine kinase [Neobacillus terrae]|uniref:sensor histidine kinase n=1 Tax=Neobacillus terrae TaxID=3034837 RepID=UPI00140E72FE|nr:HAMP domain-containing sensor histidine kinase [Neobacillus terrae]NHM30757.1 HAMP domain-containing histidine kinase [Neobacillus terrae]
MSIRLRLLLSYIAMIFIPILFAIVSALLVALLFRGDVKELRNIYLPPEHQIDLSKKDEFFLDLHRQSIKDPSLFLNPTYLNKIDKELKKSGSSLVIRNGKKITYLSETLKGLDTAELPRFGAYRDIDPVERIDHQFVSIKQLDFFFRNGAEGSLFFISDASSLAKFVRSFFPGLFIGLILILIITNGLLTYYVSRSIIRPIRELQKAAKEMKDGNLHVEIEPRSKDELGQLAMDFDEMRVRLKESMELQAAYEANRKELIANISHDLKTPITTIKGYVEGIRDGVANSPDRMNRYIQTIYNKSIDLDHMIDELFLYSKLDLQRLPFLFEKIQFDHYIQDFVEELQFDVEDKYTEVLLEIEKNGVYKVLGDREHLKRVIANIVNNSLKYIEKENKKLSFHLCDIQTHIQLSIKDNGPGISPENLPLIFDRFYRADLARGTEKGGSGLGLSIAKRIIEEHHGSIWAESSEGEGTTISFTLKKAGEQDENDLNH